MSNPIPLVSIIIPVYNGANYLNEAIDSALAQTYPNVEIIVINDGSSDNGETEKIALSYGNKIRYFYKENGKVASALNLGIRKMEGEYFSWLSHDDIYCPEKINNQIIYLHKLQKNVILYSDYDFVDENGHYLFTQRNPNIEPKEFKYALMTSHPIHGCTVLIPSFIFEEVGFFDEQLRTVQDYDMWYRISKKYEFHHMTDLLIKSRLHNEQDTNKIISIHISECDEFYRKCLADINANDIFNRTIDKFNFFIQSAFHAIKHKRFLSAQKALEFTRFYNQRYLTINYWLILAYFFYKKHRHQIN
ncbi:glycosyltransferase [Crenothrix polyspora]|uniref:Glycosyl transferase family 2 n=1 Tax=Crenothrix polyspora TaxID=360316 RepID=A0A1R4HCT7_9GAMM|nr:glycosyltransferase [Crenothrix polyspora]SJM94027.1 Glycosyl transferase family 2 [Crenothrix polyspora]